MSTISMSTWTTHVAELCTRLVVFAKVKVDARPTEIWVSSGHCSGSITLRPVVGEKLSEPRLHCESGAAITGNLQKLEAGVADYQNVLCALRIAETYFAHRFIEKIAQE
jgi:hypothetical protein